MAVTLAARTVLPQTATGGRVAVVVCTVNRARCRSASRELEPTSSSNSPGSTTRWPAASTMVQADTAISIRAVTDAPGGTSTRWNDLSSLAAHVTLVTTSVT